MGKLWTNTSYKSFVTALTLCGFTSYMFGWHVHEKAVLMILVPLTLLAADDNAHFRTFTLASVAGIYSLFPLLFKPAEAAIEVVYSSVWMVLVFLSLSKIAYQYVCQLLYSILLIIRQISRFTCSGGPGLR